MIACVGSLESVIQGLPAYKTEVQGKTIVVHVRGGEPACSLVLMEQAKHLDGKALLQCQDDQVVKSIPAWVEGNKVWVDIPKEEPKKASSGFGLGMQFAAEVQQHQPLFSQPAVPEPWMGTYGDKFPVLPGQTHEPRGLDWQRAFGGNVDTNAGGPQQTQTQMKLSSMFSASPMKVKPMDF